MQTAFRAIVMLSVLVVIPAAWIHYGPLPPRAQAYVDRVTQAARSSFGMSPVDAQQPIAAAIDGASTAPPAINLPEAMIEKSLGTNLRPAAEPPADDRSLSPASQIADLAAPLLDSLRNLGAVEYVLEPWGSSGRLFRFHCNMPIAGSSNQTQRFESISEDPLGSIERVVREVSAWRTDRPKIVQLR